MKTLMRQGTRILLLLSAISFTASKPFLAQESADAPPRKVVSQTAAVYPTLARSMNIHGIVKLELLIAPNGTVKKVDVKGGHPLLTQSAVTAVGHWRFEAAAHDSKQTVEIKFEPE
jgi:TonB family protein